MDTGLTPLGSAGQVAQGAGVAAVVEPPRLEPWEVEALKKLRLLRQAGKPAILYLTESGAIQFFRGERAGVIVP